MVKILSESVYNALKAKADNYESVVSTLVSNNEGVSAEDITPQMIVDAFNGGIDNTDISQELTTAQNRIQELEQTNSELVSQVAALTKAPAVDAGNITPKEEVGGTPNTLAEFGQKHKGDTHAILNELKAQGLI